MTKVTGVIRARALPSATQHARRYSLSDPQLRGMAGMSGRFFRCLGFFTFTLQIATKEEPTSGLEPLSSFHYELDLASST
jgi:hypothetical protein